MAKRVSTKNVSKDAIGKEITTVALLGAGVVLGSVGGQMLNVNSADTRMSLKKLARPLVLMGAGAIGSIKFENEHMKNLAKGFAISGILIGAKVILRKDFLAGLEGFEGLGETDAYGEPIGNLQNVPLYIEPQTVGTTDNEPLLLGEGIGADELVLP